MKLKALSAIAVGTTLVALDANSSQAKPVPADQWHWSYPVNLQGNTLSIPEYKRVVNISTPISALNQEAQVFIDRCTKSGKVVRARGFLNRKHQVEWSKAEFLCMETTGGPGLRPETAGMAEQEIRVFGRGPTTLRECEPYSGSTKRIWTNCGEIVQNDRISKVFVGDGQNAGRTLETDRTGSGVNTVEPVLLPEVEQMREKIFRERIAAGYYNRS
jgi:hypothetical protein